MATALRTMSARRPRRNRRRALHAQFCPPRAGLDDEHDDAIMLTPPGRDAS
jgi:hypothetical protein